MPIRRPIAALIFAGALALTGCTPDDGGEPEQEVEQEADPELGGEQEQPTPPEPEVDDVPDVVAEVNGDEIDKDTFVATYSGQLQQTFMMQQGQEVDQGELKTQVADQLVSNLLLVQAAEDKGIEASDEDVDNALNALLEQNQMESIDELIAAFEEEGVTEEIVRADAASQVKINAFIDQEVDVDEPSDEELEEQYDALLEQLGDAGEGDESEVPEFDELRDMLAEEATQEQQNEQVQKILEELRDGADITIHL